MTISKEELAELKGQGFIKQREGNYFAVRILSHAGNLNSKEMMEIAEIAEKYGQGYMGFTTRLCVEVPWIAYENIPAVKKQLKEAKLYSGGTGAKVRPLVACKGTVCSQGLLDTQKLCNTLHEQYFTYTLPSKFKIGIAGCPNNCTKAQLHDLGLMGQMIPKLDEERCNGCGLCTHSCRAGAISIENKKAIIDRGKCVDCGKCVQACKRRAMTSQASGIALFVGGRFGRRHRLGDRIPGLFSYEEIPDLVGKILEFYKKHGKERERFADTLERVGVHLLETILLAKEQKQ